MSELKDKALGELKELLAKEQAALRHARVQARTGSLKQFHVLGNHRTTIARILTLLTSHK